MTSTSVTHNHEILELIAAHSPDLIYRWRFAANGQAQVIYINPVVTTTLGLTPDQLYQDFAQFRHLFDDRWLLLTRTPAGQSPTDAPVRVEQLVTRWQHVNGDPVWLEHRLTITREEADQGYLVDGIARDITRQSLIERQMEVLVDIRADLRKAERFSDVMQVLLEQIIRRLDMVGAALFINPPAAGTLATTVELSDYGFIRAVQGAWTVVSIGDVLDTRELRAKVMEHKECHIDNDFKAMPGIQAVVSLPLVNAGTLVGVLCAGHAYQITDEDLRILTALADMAASALNRAMTFELMELKVAERTAQLEQANRELLSANLRLRQLDTLKSKFVSDVSHELRTPITNLGVYIYLLENSTPEQHTERFEVLKDQVRRLRILVEDILSLSRLEAEKGSIKFQPVNLNHIVSATVTATLPRADDDKVQLSFVPDHQLPTIDAEPNQLHQVAVNLIVNALNYTPQGFVKVTTGHDAERQQVWLRVEDSGIGIAPEDREHIFDRFYRGKRASQSDIPGTGLGLGIVREIVDIHRGKIDVQSEVDRGTTFTIYLPYKQPRH